MIYWVCQVLDLDNFMYQAVPGLLDLFLNRPAANKFSRLSDIVSALFNIALLLATFLAFYFLIWGAFAYLMSGGDKENLAKARARIRWALIGLLVTYLAYSIAVYAAKIFPPGRGGVPF